MLIIGANSYPYSIATTSNRLTKEAGPTLRNYTYNADGSPSTNGQDTYSYYASGRLKQVTRTIGTTPTNLYSLRYNGLGQLVHRTNNNQYYTYDQFQHLIGEYTSTGDVSQETVWLGNTPMLTLRPNAQERIADNNSTIATNKATLTGTWAAATTLKGYYGSNYHSHTNTNNTTTPDKITYTLTPTATQRFNLYARWVAQATNASNATYTIAPNTTVGGIATPPITITVNQQQNGGRWNLLTSLDLNTANPLTVTLSGQGNGAVIADAIRIVPNTPNQTQSTSYYIHTDHLNTPRVIVNANNQLRWTWYPEQAEAFGANRPNENPSNLINGTPTQLGSFSYHLRFLGQLFDPATGLSYNYFRDYNPRTGRFPESDPIGLAGGINTYGYVGGNPLWYVDPLGLKVLRNYNGGSSAQIRYANRHPKDRPPISMSGTDADKVYQELPENICDYWPAYCIPEIPQKPEKVCQLSCPPQGECAAMTSPEGAFPSLRHRGCYEVCTDPPLYWKAW